MIHATALEGQFLPVISDKEHKRFTPSELVLYMHALQYKWIAEEEKKVITMLRDPEFDSHKQMEKSSRRW
jgi:hypothetical protein